MVVLPDQDKSRDLEDYDGNALWVQYYKPRIYFDLLSDEVISF